MTYQFKTPEPKPLSGDEINSLSRAINLISDCIRFGTVTNLEIGPEELHEFLEIAQDHVQSAMSGLGKRSPTSDEPRA